MKTVTSILLAATMISVVACGKKDSDSSRPTSKNFLLTEAGHYEAKLFPVNAHVAGDVTGRALVKVNGDDMTFEVKVNNSPAQIAHAQYIHVADSCPTLSSDVNKDGVIDAVEGRRNYGPAIIPLDFHLKTQIEKDIRFPSADFSGDYFYRQSVSMLEMMKDLMTKDLNLSDNIVKVKSGLGLAGRQIVIYGVPTNANLPDTVAALKGQTKHSSLPIACGAFVKVAVTNEGGNSNGGKEE